MAWARKERARFAGDDTMMGTLLFSSNARVSFLFSRSFARFLLPSSSMAWARDGMLCAWVKGGRRGESESD